MGKKRFFNVLNIVDILIIVIVIAVGILGIKIIKSNSSNSIISSAKTKEIEYVVNSQHQGIESVEYVKVGDKVWNSTNLQYLGVVTNVEYTKQTAPMFNPNTGLYEEYEIPNKYSINITIKGNGTESDENIVVEGTNVKIGTQLNVKGKGYVFIAYVVDILLK